MTDDRNAELSQELIASGVVQVIMAIDCILHGLLYIRIDHHQEILERIWSEERIKQENSVITDNESRVSRCQTTRSSNRCVNTIGDFDECEIVFRFCCTESCRRKSR